jgi:hypothetical protein
MAAREIRRSADLECGCLRAITHFTQSGHVPQTKENSPGLSFLTVWDQEFPQLSDSLSRQGCGILYVGLGVADDVAQVAEAGEDGADVVAANGAACTDHRRRYRSTVGWPFLRQFVRPRSYRDNRRAYRYGFGRHVLLSTACPGHRLRLARGARMRTDRPPGGGRSAGTGSGDLWSAHQGQGRDREAHGGQAPGQAVQGVHRHDDRKDEMQDLGGRDHQRGPAGQDVPAP